jgi:uncharacterized protein (TIGR02001 family)
MEIMRRLSRVFSGMGLGLWAIAEVAFDADVTLVSKYIWRGFDTITDDRPAIQPSVTMLFGQSGLWLNLWSATALADTDFTELDLVAGYERPLSEHFALSIGAGYFTFPRMPHYPDENSTTPEAYVGLTASSFPFSPSATLYYDFNLGDGVYATLSLSRDFEVKGKTVHLSSLAGYTRQYQGIGVDPGFSDVCLGLSTDVGFRGLMMTPSLNYVIVPNRTVNDENEFWVGLSIGWSTGRSTDATD